MIVAAVLIAFSLGTPFGLPQARAQTAGQDHWVVAWGSAQQAPEELLGIRAETFADQTIRMAVRATLAGSSVRVLLSNELSAHPLRIGAAHIALAGPGCSIVPGSDRLLTFGGQPSITIPPGAPGLSDPVGLIVPALGELAISLFLPEKSSAPTFHALAQHPTCVSGPGNLTAQGQLATPVKKRSWYWLEGVQVLAPANTSVIAALGDSITDGYGAKGEYAAWPDLLAKRLSSVNAPARFSVINEGIGGNRLLHDGDGPSALARLDRDVLSQPGVRDLIVLEGINDIGWPYLAVTPASAKAGVRQFPFQDEKVDAAALIQALRQIVERAHVRGVKVFGCTLTPYQGAAYYTSQGEAIREAVNRWIRTSHAFDGVIDFDAVVRDPAHPTQFLPRYQSGDRLHPSDAGYKVMVDAIDLTVFQSQAASAK